MNFDLLVQSISDVHRQLQAQAIKAVNTGLTLRNWLIGGLIVEYEIHGEDRAVYGEKIIPNLAEKLRNAGMAHAHRRDLYRYCDFYRAYPQIVETLSPQLAELLPVDCISAAYEKVETSPQIADDPIVRSPTGKLRTPGKMLLERLSYSHLELLAPLDPPLVRAFYEIECIKGGWSVRELKRQIGSLYFERSGLSKDKEALKTNCNPETNHPWASFSARARTVSWCITRWRGWTNSFSSPDIKPTCLMRRNWSIS